MLDITSLQLDGPLNYNKPGYYDKVKGNEKSEKQQGYFK